MKRQKKTVIRQLRQDLPYIGLAVAVVVLAAFVIVPSTTIQLGGKIVNHVPTDQKVVALTLDDGPKQPYVNQTIATLAKYDVRATFFLIGLEIERNPTAAKALVDAGHQIGNHGYSHRSLAFMNEPHLKAEISQTDALIRELGYTDSIVVRPPYGHKFLFLPQLLTSQNRETIMWNIAPDDVAKRSAREIADAVIDEAQPGSIIVMHTMEQHRQTSRDALDLIIPEMQADGYRFVTINELLNYRSRLDG